MLTGEVTGIKTNPSHPRKILITGHTGFKGTWLTLLLKEIGFEIAGFSLEATPDSLLRSINEKLVDFEVIGDIRDRNALAKCFKQFKPDFLVHMAAQPIVRKSYENTYETFEINALGTANVLDESRRIENLISVGIVTTDKVYLNDDRNNRFVETSPLGGKDPYSASKVGTEAAVMAWRALSQNSLSKDASIISLRAGNVVGGGDLAEDRLLPDIVRSLKSGVPVVIRNSKSTRPWQHVLDPVYGYLQAILDSKTSRHEDYNFGPTERSLTVETVVDIAERHWGELPKHKLDQQTDSSPEESKLLEIDPTKAIKELNWSPVWTQESAVIRTLKWWDRVNKGELSPFEACTHDINDFLSYK